MEDMEERRERRGNEHDSNGERKKSGLFRVLRLILSGELDWITEQEKRMDQ